MTQPKVDQVVLLEPHGPLFFGDGRPFAAGEYSQARTMFPPSPFSVQGVFRHVLLETACARVPTYLGGCADPDTHAGCDRLGDCAPLEVLGASPASWAGRRHGETGGTLAAGGPWLAWRNVDGAMTQLLPCPLDLVRKTEGRKQADDAELSTTETALIAPSSREAKCSLPNEAPMPLVFSGEAKGLARVGGWLSWPAFASYLRGEAPRLTRGTNWWLDRDLWTLHRRSGVTIDRTTRRASAGLLYFPEYAHPAAGAAGRLVLLAAVAKSSLRGCELPSSFTVAIGGERKPVSIELAADGASLAWASIPDGLESANVKVVLTQPAWFSGGWRLPSGLASACKAARTERAEVLGGWDLANRRPRTIRRFVPRGSVFYLQFGTCEEAKAVRERLWNASVTETPSEEPVDFAGCGFGHVLTGIW